MKITLEIAAACLILLAFYGVLWMGLVAAGGG